MLSYYLGSKKNKLVCQDKVHTWLDLDKLTFNHYHWKQDACFNTLRMYQLGSIWLVSSVSWENVLHLIAHGPLLGYSVRSKFGQYLFEITEWSYIWLDLTACKIFRLTVYQSSQFIMVIESSWCHLIICIRLWVWSLVFQRMQTSSSFSCFEN